MLVIILGHFARDCNERPSTSESQGFSRANAQNSTPTTGANAEPLGNRDQHVNSNDEDNYNSRRGERNDLGRNAYRY